MFYTKFTYCNIIKFCVSIKHFQNKTFFSTATRIPNPITNQIERNIAKDEPIKDVRFYKPKNYYGNDDDIE